MSDPVIATPTEVPEDLRWLRATRALAFFSLLLVVITAVPPFFDTPADGATSLIVVLFTAPLWLPYLWIVLRLRAKNATSQKKGLALAVAYGSCILVPVVISVVVVPIEQSLRAWKTEGPVAVFALLQLFLVVSSVKAYYRMKPEPGDRRILRNRFAWGLVSFFILVSAAIHIPCLLRSKLAANEASAIGELRTICTAQSSYAEKHPDKSFAAGLSDLGPPPGADFIDPQLASGTRHGYAFTIVPGPADSRGRITKYAVTARPQAFQQSGTRSFFTDESGVIRFTAEDRPPTAQDRPLD